MDLLLAKVLDVLHIWLHHTVERTCENTTHCHDLCASVTVRLDAERSSGCEFPAKRFLSALGSRFCRDHEPITFLSEKEVGELEDHHQRQLRTAPGSTIFTLELLLHLSEKLFDHETSTIAE